MKARLIKRTWDNPEQTIASFYFKPDRPYYFTAGQYADMTVPHEKPDKRGLTRTMTFTSNPSEALLRVTMRIPASKSSFKQSLLQLEANSPVSLTDAMGDMVLPLDPGVPLVFVAGGVGIASYISMILWLASKKDSRDITLLYTVRNTDDIIYQEVFDAYVPIGNLKRILFTTDNKVDGASWPGKVKKTRLTSRDIMEHAAGDSQIYISGTEAMVNQLQEELQHTYNVPQYRLAFDYFEGYSEL